MLGHERSSVEDSFSREGGLLDHPHYTRPADVRGLGVPEVLLSGDHGAVARWRQAQALERTQSAPARPAGREDEKGRHPMFTGIVTHRGNVLAARDGEGGGRRFVLVPDAPLAGVQVGDSIAVDGVCLTVCDLPEGKLAFDVVPETLRKTTLGRLRAGDGVNLERALSLGAEMGGHMVQGHVEGVGTLAAVDRQGEDVRMAIQVPEALLGGLIPKGSVTVDGVSLTIGEVWQDDEGGGFSVYLVPHTLAVTGLGRRTVGDTVNIEPDVMGRWVEHHVRRMLENADDLVQAIATRRKQA